MNGAELNSEDLIVRLRATQLEVEQLQAELASFKDATSVKPDNITSRCSDASPLEVLMPEEFRRYGRQMILPEIGMPNQLKLRNASVLIVGLGGLGCPAAAYLAGAGIGTLGLIDGDTVDLSNLHRQILHNTQSIDRLKVESAATYIQRLNPNVRCKRYPRHLEPGSALEIYAEYDLVLDCTDHPSSRYLISDAAVCSGIPLVSAAALRTDGQLFVLNNPPFHSSGTASGPCYRCLNPKPPPANTVMSCGEGGILGPVVGTMGVLMATEAIKIMASPRFPFRNSLGQEFGKGETKLPDSSMLIYSAFSSTPFRSIKLRGRKANCPACSSSPEHRTITSETLRSNSLDYAAFCGINQPLEILDVAQRVTPATLKEWSEEPDGRDIKDYSALVLDVRDATQFGICNLPGSLNIPIMDLEATDFALTGIDTGPAAKPIVIVCRFGNDSQLAVKGIREKGSIPGDQPLFDLQGGLQAWRRQIDPEFPEY